MSHSSPPRPRPEPASGDEQAERIDADRAERAAERAKRRATRAPGDEQAPARRPEPEPSPISKALERVLIVLASFAVAVVAIGLLTGYFTANDPANVTGSLGGPGLVYRDLGHGHLLAGQPHPAYDSNPPTSGAFVPTPVRADGSVLTDDQILTALAAGNVVVIYGGATPPPGLAALARATAGRFTPALAADGEAVILARLPRVNGLIALAWTRLLPITGITRLTSANDSVLNQFIEAWLGLGARGSRG